MTNNPTISTYTIFPPPAHSHHLSLLPLPPPQLPNPYTLPPPPYPKPLNPLALPYQKEPTSPPSPPKMEQTSLLLSKPCLPHEIYQQLPPSQVRAPFVAPSNYYYSSSTLIYQHSNSNFPTFFTRPPQPQPPPPVPPPRSYYTLNAFPSSPSPLSASPSDDQKNKAAVTKLNSWRRRRKFSLPPRNMTSSEKSYWVPKNHSSLGTGKRMGKICADVERTEKEAIDLRGKTSLMIRNIPNQFNREGLMRILDSHCREENKKAFSAGSNPVWSEYDFLYLPMDFRRLANLGYAFVNFTSEVAASRFWETFNGYTWRVSKNQKTCEIAPALIQGKEGLRMHFRNSVFRCHTDGYLPVTFSPPRNGSTLSEPNLVGKRVEATALIKSPSPTIRRKSRS